MRDRPILSFDNDKIHTSASLAEGGIDRGVVLKLPARSPDLHRVIERVHARICTEFRKQLYYDHSICSLKQYKSLLEKIFYQSQTAAVISADVRGLPVLYEKVQQKRGGYVPKKFC